MIMTDFKEVTSKDIEFQLIHLPQIVFEVTDACNLRCKYCAYADLYEGYDRRENLKISYKKATLIWDYLCDLWEKNCAKDEVAPFTIGFYGGEPLLNVPFIKQMMNYAEASKPVGKKLYYSMTSNAMLLDKYMDFLAEKRVQLLISLDGDEDGQGYRVDVTGKNSFQKVFSNIRLLQEKYPEYFKKFVKFNSVLHNKNSIEETYYFIKNAFGKAPSIVPLNTSGIRLDKVEEFNRTYRNYTEDLQETNNCEALKEEMFINNPETSALLNYLYYQSGNVFFKWNNLLMKNVDAPIPPTGTCTPFAKKMFITVKGRILQCERINHEFTVGQVTDTSVELDWERIAEQHNNYVFKYANQCKHCGNRKTCMQCVYQIDDIHEPHTKCRGFCTEVEKKRENDKCLEYLTEHPQLYKRLLSEVVIRG